MRVEIVLFFILEASLAANEDGNDGTGEHKVEGHSQFGILDKWNSSRTRRFVPGPQHNVTLNVHPDDVKIIKDAIKKLLDRTKVGEIMHRAPTSPTRSPTPLREEFVNDTGTTSSTSSSQTGHDDNADIVVSVEHPPTTKTDAVQKLNWFEKKGEHDIKYKAETNSTLFPLPLAGVAPQNITRTSHVTPTDQLPSAASVETSMYTEDSLAANASSSPAPLRSNTADALRQADRTRNTRRTTASTRNTLCTDSDDFCRTMCFDREKYRVSCPTTAPPPTTPRLDMTKLLSMLSSLVADYDTNLTAVMNQTLIEQGYKHCEPTTTTATTTSTTAPPTPPIYDYEPSDNTGSVISKCYVCGMEELGIPRHAHCADPFAKDLLPPQMPDRLAEIKRKGYRKYCKYMDMRPWYINGSGIWGKWSGGCSVRWVDLSGVYTQRTCRIRERPAIGHHFVSKRLAKLEFALRKVDNGCILSPMATLVPFSRGVSLYARLHACVCSANWCNRAGRLATPLWLWPTMEFVIAVLR